MRKPGQHLYRCGHEGIPHEGGVRCPAKVHEVLEVALGVAGNKDDLGHPSAPQ